MPLTKVQLFCAQSTADTQLHPVCTYTLDEVQAQLCPQHPSNRRFSGLRSQYGHFAKEKDLLPLAAITPHTTNTLTGLSKLMHILHKLRRQGYNCLWN